MTDPEDRQWLHASVNDLSNLLQVITESTQALQPVCEQHPDGTKYYAFLRNGLERARYVTANIVSRLGGVADTNAVTAAHTSPVAAPSEIVIANPEGKRELVLIIDDEEIVCTLACEMLANAGYRVVTVADPFRALTVFRKLKDTIALVILDFTLPIMDGAEVFEELKSINPSIAVMLSSGFTEQDKVRVMLAKGLRGFLPKPYSEERLLTQVRTTLDTIHAEKTGERRVL